MSEEAKKENAQSQAPQMDPILKQYRPQILAELDLLHNIEVFLKKINGLNAEEALAYADCRHYIFGRAQLLHRTERMRIENDRIAKEKAEAELKKEEAAKETSKAPSNVVPIVPPTPEKA